MNDECRMGSQWTSRLATVSMGWSHEGEPFAYVKQMKLDRSLD